VTKLKIAIKDAGEVVVVHLSPGDIAQGRRQSLLCVAFLRDVVECMHIWLHAVFLQAYGLKASTSIRIESFFYSPIGFLVRLAWVSGAHCRTTATTGSCASSRSFACSRSSACSSPSKWWSAFPSQTLKHIEHRTYFNESNVLKHQMF
jgi:hypothetical protein